MAFWITSNEIHHPALVVHGSNDLIIPTINGFTLQQHLPNAQLIIYPDSNHGSVLPISGTVPGPRLAVPGR